MRLVAILYGMSVYTAQQAARILGIAHTSLCWRARVSRMRGKPIGRQIGQMWLFSARDLERLRTAVPKPGRPKGVKA